MKITEALLAEHEAFLKLFTQIERVLPGSATAAEVRMLARIVEGLLLAHAEAETNLAYLALDHALAQTGKLERMHQEHHEIDARLKGVQKAVNCAEAQRLLREALAASREHFNGEERTVFPMLERVLKAETLVELGTAWLRRPANSLGGAPLAAG